MKKKINILASALLVSIVLSVACYASGLSYYTKVMLHMNGADTSTTFTDSSYYHNTFTAAGSAQIDTAQSKFGGASGLFDGTGDYISTPAPALSHLTNNNFSIECWTYLNEAMGTIRNIAGMGGGVNDWNTTSGHEWILEIYSDSKLYFVYNKATVATSVGSTGTIAIASGWHHIAVVRFANVISLYVDGVSVGSGAETGSISSITGGTPILIIGSNSYPSGGSTWKGWIDEFRLQVGQPGWSTAFTAPTNQYSAVPYKALTN